MSVTITGRDMNLGISYEISGSTPKTVLSQLEEFLELLSEGDRAVVGAVHDAPTATPTVPAPAPATDATNDPFYAEKMSEKAVANGGAGSDSGTPTTGAKSGSPPIKMAADGAVCETCGAALSESEARTSRLFVSKLVCKSCLQKLGA